ncbi:aspartate/glutamate racemase family protein [Labilibaculum sp.]|uniref:aspartate/glutamate racemase family protein n=1 Tax=Labilibaculum sp. TaxID=2060723 RepID=UPI003568280E
MRKLGLIGGTSWHSTIEYYRYINESVNAHFGDNTNPPLLVYTLNQSLVHRFQVESNWDGIAELLIETARSLEKAGAESVMFCANTPHKVYTTVEAEINIPIIHIADATSEAIKSKKVNKVCFLGTKYSMLEDFITQRIENQNIEVLVPQTNQIIEELHRIIQKELTYGTILPESKKYVISVIQNLVDSGAEGVVLGCTEFPLMIKEADLEIPIFNTTEIHAKAGVNFILKDLKK